MGLFVGLLIAFFTLPINNSWRSNLAVGVLSLFLTVTVFLTLKNTPYSLNGTGADQRLITAYVTKFATYSSNVDVIYKGLPAFYPPLYFYILGRLGAFFTIEPYKMIKFGLVGVTFLTPFVTWWLWRRLTPAAVAVAFVALFYHEWFKPFEWISLTMFVPWWLYWVDGITLREVRPATRSHQLWWFVIGGFIGSLIFQTYYYWFFIGGISWLLTLIASWFEIDKDDASRWQNSKNGLLMLASTAFFSILYWGPYLYSMYVTGGWQPLQNRWISAGKIPLPLPFLDDSIEGLFLAGGLLYLLLSAGKNRVSRGLLTLVCAVYGWSILGYVGILTDKPLLTFRAYPLIEYLLAIAACLALMRLWQERFYTRLSIEIRENWAFHRLAPALILLLLLFFSQEMVQKFSYHKYVEKALQSTEPEQMLSAFDTMINQDAASRSSVSKPVDKVILLGYPYRDLPAYRPIYHFLPWSAHFSHPAGRFYDRVDFLEKLSVTNSADLFAAAFMNNRYSKIDAVMLESDGRAWRLEFLDDNFPDRTKSRLITLAHFDEPYFQRQDVDEYTLFTPVSANDPLKSIPFQELSSATKDAALSPETLLLLYALTTTFGEHVELEGQEAASRNSVRMRANTEQLLMQADLSVLSIEALLDLQLAAEGPLSEKARQLLLSKLPFVTDTLLTDEHGAQKLRILGYTILEQAAAPAELAIYFEVLDQLEQDYTIWVHANVGETQHNLDHQPSLPTSAWQPGQIYRDTQLLQIEPGEYHFSFGLWQSDDKSRLLRESGEHWIDMGVYQLK